MSAKSDKYEQDVAEAIDATPGVTAERPKVSVKFADVLITEHNNKKVTQPVWVEVKMSHTDNLGNPRVAWDGKEWTASYAPGEKSPIKDFAIKYLSESREVKKFIAELAKFSGIKNPKIPTTKGGLKDPDAVPLDVMKKFFKNKNQYILDIKNVDLGKMVTQHYLVGKAQPAYYMQAGDDFYRIGSQNPLKLPVNIPLLSGRGDFKMRIGLRTEFYEVQPEIKIVKMPYSNYSIKPGTSKKNPFAK